MIRITMPEVEFAVWPHDRRDARGAIGYIPSDSLFNRQVMSYENSRTRLKPGYAENAIVNGFLEMMSHP